jgi:hypothetical protein
VDYINVGLYRGQWRSFIKAAYVKRCEFLYWHTVASLVVFSSLALHRCKNLKNASHYAL